MGMPGWRLGAPKFEDVEVPQENLLGEEGAGFKLAMMTFDQSRPTVASQSVGVGQGAIDLALDYALRRHAFGQPLFAPEGIQFKLAVLEAEVAAARARLSGRHVRGRGRPARLEDLGGGQSCSPPTWR